LVRRDELIGKHLTKRGLARREHQLSTNSSVPCILTPEVTVCAFCVFMKTESVGPYCKHALCFIWKRL
jgi:hypothetical protein